MWVTTVNDIISVLVSQHTQLQVFFFLPLPAEIHLLLK